MFHHEKSTLMLSLPLPHRRICVRAVWELPNSRYVESMLEEHGVKCVKIPWSLLLWHATMIHARRHTSKTLHLEETGWQEPVSRSAQARHCFRHTLSGEVADDKKQTSSPRDVSFDISVARWICPWSCKIHNKNVHDSDGVHRQRLGV